MKELRGLLLLQTGVSWASVIIELGAGFLIAPFLLKYLGAEKYGVWVVCNSTTALFALLDLGLRGTLVRSITMAARPADVLGVVTLITRYLLLAAAMAAVGHFVIGLVFPTLFPKAPAMDPAEITGCLAILGLSLVPIFLNSVLTAYLTADSRVHEANLVATIATLVRIPLSIAAVAWTESLLALAAVVTGTTALQSVALRWRGRHLYSLREILLSPASMAALRGVRGHAAYSFTVRSCSIVYTELSTYLAMLLLGPLSVAALSFCMLLVGFSRRLIESFGVNIFPHVLRACAKGDLGQLRHFFEDYLVHASVVAGLFYFGIAVYGADFLGIWLAPQRFEVAGALVVLALGSLLGGLGSFAPGVFEGMGKFRRSAAVYGCEIAGFLLLGLVLVSGLGLGLTGIALAYVLPRIVSSMVFLHWLAVETRLGHAALLRFLARQLPWWGFAAATTLTAHWLVPPVSWPTLSVSVLLAGAAYLAVVLWRHHGVLLPRAAAPTSS